MERGVLITGASGMIGSHLAAELLGAGGEVSVLLRDPDHRSPLFRSGDIHRVAAFSGALEDIASLERALLESEAAVVFHLGAQTLVGVAQRAPLLTFESNIRGTYQLLEVCRRHREQLEAVIVASSDKAYGASERLPYTEDLPLRGEAPYEVSKSAADLIARAYFATYDLPVAIVRCGNTYGPGDLNWSRIIPGTIRSFIRGEAPEIRSDGSYRRDYIFVRDVAGAYMDLARAVAVRRDVRGEAFNFASGTTMPVLEVVSRIAEVMGGGMPEPRILNVARNEIREQWLSTAKAKDVLGWAPRFSLRDGLRETIPWYREYLSSSDD